MGVQENGMITVVTGSSAVPRLKPVQTPLRFSRTGRAKYQFRYMRIGDWFEVPELLSVRIVKKAARSYGLRYPGFACVVIVYAGRTICRREA